MKLNNILRILSGLSFLIFFCPFFQMCSDKHIMKEHRIKETTYVETPIKTIESNGEQYISKIDTIAVTEPKISDETKQKALETSREHYIKNGYGLALSVFTPKDKFSWNDFTDSSNWLFLCFSLVLLLSVILLIASFKNNAIIVRNLAISNFVLALVAVILFYSSKLLEDPGQIKYGYYLFVINTLVIIILSHKVVQRQKENQVSVPK